MRNRPLPQPGTYLGDDPDLTADLGQRLASTAQTAQGLITNYLFYGQRRAADSTATQGGERSAEAARERSLHEDRDAAAGALSGTARAARRDVDRTPERDTAPDGSVVTAQQAEEARLAFRVVGPARDDQDPLGDDHLGVDGLAEDPRQRDPLASPTAESDPGRVTLGPEGPARGR